MTAAIVYVLPNAACLLTDGMMNAPDGSTLALKQKVQIAGHQLAAFVARGPDMFSGLLGVRVGQAQGDFDQLADSFPEMCRTSHAAMMRAARQGAALPGNPHMVDAVLVGFSPARGFVAYIVTSFPQDGAPAWTLRPLGAQSALAFVSPWSEALEGDVKASGVDLWASQVSVEHHGLAVMRAQRSTGLVGGFCQLTTIMQSGVFTSVLDRWPTAQSS